MNWIEENKFGTDMEMVVSVDALREQVEKLVMEWRQVGVRPGFASTLCADELERVFLGDAAQGEEHDGFL